MNLLELKDNELRIFLEVGVPEEYLRKAYINIPGLAQKLRGFRPNKAVKQVLVNTSFSLIKNQKDAKLIEYLTKYYNGYNKVIIEMQNKYIRQGFDVNFSLAISIEEGISESFRLLYFKLENYPEDKQMKVLENIQLIKQIKMFSSEIAFNLIKKEVSKLNKNEENFNDEIDDINNQLNDYKNSHDLLEKELIETKKTINNIDVNKMMEQMSSKIIESLSQTRTELINKNIEQNKTISELKKQINNLQLQLEQISNYKEQNGIGIKYTQNNQYESFDEFLYESIGDVIENLVSDKEYDVLREYIIEILFSNKPIIASEKNSILLANILSSIITGGNFYEIYVDDNCNVDNLLLQLDRLDCILYNKVVIIKNVINVQNYHKILNYIKNRPYHEKYIFEITYDKEIVFLAPEIINDFNFFIADFDENNISCKYAYSFEKEKRKTIHNSDYEKILDDIELDLKNKELMNVKYYGLLSYSHIPFKSIHNSIEIDEILYNIINTSIRTKCEVIKHD